MNQDNKNQPNIDEIKRAVAVLDTTVADSSSSVAPTALVAEPYSNRQIYGSFILGQAEFAIAATAVQEVVNAPSFFSPVPLSPPYLKGLFTLRNLIIPVVDLALLLNLPSGSADRLIVVLECGELCIGLLLDKTKDVFDAQQIETVMLSHHPNAVDKYHSQVIKGVFKFDSGQRLVQIIDPLELLQLDKLPASPSSKHSRSRLDNRGVRRKCISFKVGEAQCAIGINAIKEIIKVGELETSALSQGSCLGHARLRSDLVPVVDFAELLGYEAVKDIDQVNSRIIIITVEGLMIGLLVTNVENIMAYYSDELIAFPAMPSVKSNLFIGCLIPETHLSPDSATSKTILLDAEKIFSNSEIESITKGNRELFEAKTRDSKATDHKLDQQTFITFTINNTYGLKMSEVKEVIELPEDLMEPPSMPKIMLGIMNLRGELIPVIDPRKIYNLKEAKSTKGSSGSFTSGSDRSSSINRNVIIFTTENLTVGLAVDSVDAIVSFNQSQAISLPSMMFDGQGEPMDVKQAYQLQGSEKAASQTVYHLDLNKLASRLGVSGMRRAG